MIRGDNPKTVAKDMIGRVDSIGITRAKLIARTEIVEAHNQAHVVEGGLLAKETGIKEQYQWIGNDDGRERPKHVSWNNNIYSKEEILSMIGEPNCRCSVSLYIDIKNL
jgi:SPP1 gp7 family putative phage head morphogenesis protein